MKMLKRITGVLTILSGTALVLPRLLLLLAGVSLETAKNGAIGVIGGADGPTAIFVAGKISPYYKFALLASPVLFVVWLCLHMKSKKGNKG